MKKGLWLPCLLGAAALMVGIVLPIGSAYAKGKPGGGGGGGGTPSGQFSCRASVARVEPAGLLAGISPIELFVANSAGAPCVDNTAGLTNQPVVINLGPTLNLSADLLVSRTDDSNQGVAHAGVANLSLQVLGQSISVSILTAEATAGPCPSTALTSESTVLSVSVNGLTVSVPSGQAPFDLTIPLLGDVLALHLNSTITTPGQVTQRALWLHSSLIGDVIVGEAVADVHGNPCGSAPPPNKPRGFMTGGGSILSTAGQVTHGAHLECVPSDGPNNLQVNWAGNRFHLESVTSSSCSDDPTINPGQPAANFDTIVGTGLGRCNGASATASWKLTDAGEPGRNDRFEITINGGGCSLSAAGLLTGGNQQAHSKG
jgi:hypothetical protein